MLNLDCTPSLHWCKVSECLTQWMFTWREMNKRADISLALTTVSITSESLMWNGLKVSFWTAVYSTTVAGVHDNTRALCHTQLCHPWKQEEVGLVEDSSHVVAMATAPPGRQDKRSSSQSTRQHAFVFRKLLPIMWFCLSDENTSPAFPVSLAQGRSTLRHVSAESHTSLTKEYKQVYGIKHPYN